MHQNRWQLFKPSHDDRRSGNSEPARDWLLYLEAAIIGAMTIAPLALMLWSLINDFFEG